MKERRKELTSVVKASHGSQRTVKPLCFAVVGVGNPEHGQKKKRRTKKYENLTCRKLRIDVFLAKIGGSPGSSKRLEKSKLPILARNLAVEGTAAIGLCIGRTCRGGLKGGQFIMNLHSRKWLCLVSVLAVAGVML